MKFSTLFIGSCLAAIVAADSSKKCQPFTVYSKTTACYNDYGGCVMGGCDDKFFYLKCYCPDDHPHVKCGYLC
jgi:hypothetical protein